MKLNPRTRKFHLALVEKLSKTTSLPWGNEQWMVWLRLCEVMQQTDVDALRKQLDTLNLILQPEMHVWTLLIFQFGFSSDHKVKIMKKRQESYKNTALKTWCFEFVLN